jgi:hypothetical protein
MRPCRLGVSRCRPGSIHLILLFLLTTPALAQETPAPGTPKPVFEDGANCLFIAHSFFRGTLLTTNCRQLIQIACRGRPWSESRIEALHLKRQRFAQCCGFWE